MTSPTPSPISDQAAGEPHPSITRAIAQEERACRAEDALIDLVNQIRKSNPVDDHGHDLKMNRAYLEAERLLDSTAATTGSAPVATLHDDGYYTFHGEKPHGFNYQGWRMDVYAATASPAASAPEQGPTEDLNSFQHRLRQFYAPSLLTEHDIGREIFREMKHVNMINADWDSGVVLGADNGFRYVVILAARRVIALLAASMGGDKS